MIPEKAISKYLKVKTMAERGEEGERKAAAGILLMLNKKYPGIGSAAAARQASERGNDTGHADPPGEAPPPGVWSKGPSPSPQTQAAEGNWENIFQILARNMGTENVQLVAKENPSGSISINVRIPSEVIEVLDGHLSFAQKSAFRDAVLERFQEALDVAVWGSSES